MARILVVDDDPMYLELIREMLERGGHTAVAAENGRQCLDQLGTRDEAGRHQVDVVVTDLFMPQMNGVELLVAIRDLCGTSVPVIVVTSGHADLIRPFTQACLKMGCDAVLAKPFSAADLQDALARVRAGCFPGEAFDAPVGELRDRFPGKGP